MQRIFWIIAIVVVVVLAVAYYNHRSARHAVESGDVLVRDQAGDNAKAGTQESGPANQTEQPGGTDETAQQGVQPAGQTGSGAPAPAADSIPRTPPNGMLFAGIGKYQLYRQGDITWRLNTDTGEACILFATDAEWRKPRVYQQGCSVH
jgi:hypothetical protein